MVGRRSSGAAVAALFVLAGAEPAAAQPAAADPVRAESSAAPPASPSIVELEFRAAPSEAIEALRKLAGLEIGDPYGTLAIRKAVRRLFQTGRFQNVYVRAARVEGGLRLRFELPPRQRLTAIEVDDPSVLSQSEVLEATKATVGQSFDTRDLPEWKEALERTLIRQGYRSPKIEIGHRLLDEEGGVEVRLRLREGPVTTLGAFVVSGSTRRPLWRIENVIEMDPGDVLDLDRVDENIEALKADYRAAGYLDAQVAQLDVRGVPSASSDAPVADVMLRVDAGPKVTVRYRGHRVVGIRALEEDGELLVELGTGPGALAEVREKIVSRYERRGYWRVKVAVASRITPDGDRKEILFSIRENKPSVVRQLRFPGNRLFDEGQLVDTVVELVRDSLGEVDGQPGADSEVVDAVVGTASDSRRSPDTSAPDPRRVYIPQAYRAAQDELADLFRAEGYQTVDIGDPIIEPVGLDVVDVAFPIRQGVKWQIGAVSFSGNQQVTSLELLGLTDLDPGREGGQPLAFDDVETARRAIIKHYRDQGYLYVQLAEELRPLRDRSFGLEVRTSTTPATIRQVCARAEAAGQKTCDVELVFQLEEGPLVITQDIIVRGVETTWDSIVAAEIVVAQDTVLRAKDMEQTRDNLLRLGLFDRVDVHPLDEDVVGDRKDVLVEVKERDHYWLELGVGASTEDGIRASVAFGDGNLFGSALRVQIQGRLNIWLPPLLVLYNDAIRDQIEPFYNRFGVLGRLEYEVAAGFSYPRIPGLPRGFSAGLDVIALRDFDPAFLENTQTLTLLATYKDGDLRQLSQRRPSFQLRANLERTELECNQIFRGVTDQNQEVDIIDILGSLAVRCSTVLSNPDDPNNINRTFRGTNFYLSVGPRITWDLRDDSLDPKNGAYFELEAFYAVGLDADSPDYVNLNGRVNVYVQVLPRLVFAVSALAARLFQIGPSELEIPLNRRLFAGGRTTIRGYPEKTLLPQDIEIDAATGRPVSTISTGGQLLVALKTELRVLLFPSLALALFYDVGDLWEDGEFSLETGERMLAQGSGVGLRVATPIGPLAIDLAVPVNRRNPGPANVQLHFAVGSF